MTWQKTFQELRPTAAAILRLTAYLAPDPIPSKMFEDEAEIVGEAVGMLCEETGAQVEGNSVKEAITELVSYSMVTRKGESFTVHRMVQDALRSRIPEKVRGNWVGLSLRIVSQFAPFQADDVRTWPVWDLLRPHAARVAQHADDAQIAEPTSVLMNQLVLLLLGKSLYREAEPLMRRSLQIDEESLGLQHPNVAIRLNNLASLLQETNRLSEAEPLLRRALQIGEDTLGPQHPKVAIRLNNLAQLLKATNRLTEAEPLMRRALQIDEDSFGPQHPNVAKDLNNLASLLQVTNRLTEAKPLMRRALQIAEDSLGPQHPEVARALNNLAQLLKTTNRLAEAEPLMRRALEIVETSLGTEHPKTQLVRENLEGLHQEIAAQSRKKGPKGPKRSKGR